MINPRIAEYMLNTPFSIRVKAPIDAWGDAPDFIVDESFMCYVEINAVQVMDKKGNEATSCMHLYVTGDVCKLVDNLEETYGLDRILIDCLERIDSVVIALDIYRGPYNKLGVGVIHLP